ncbi:hypothetical protein B0H17DRAFT_1144757 [Mycena rosella]|uniref:Uncharacterized protein n=1 Tax=Mycena rosella TaxID=1033263 RepID=A0AAD7CW14_MYCRO|nr:hypothetical protein B0H17DRAFT_1144757 [Mycena rosella]
MFLAASIALASILSLSKFTVNSAPVTARQGRVAQFCTGDLFGGVCTPLNGTSCTNTPGVESLVLNRDANCQAFPLPDCAFNSTQSALQVFSDISLHLAGKGIQSVQCVENAGTENGNPVGSAAALAQEVADSDASQGIVIDPPANCTEGPVEASPEEQASAAANGIVLSGPVTCT